MSANQFAFEFNTLSQFLRSFALQLTHDTHQAEDLFQDTALLAFKHREKFRTDTNLKAWLATIMRNTFINGFRKKQRRGEILDQSQELFLLNAGQGQINNAAEGNLQLEELITIVESLPEELRKPFLLFFQGYKYDEISQELDIPLGTTKSRIFQARKRMKKQINAIYRIPELNEIAA